MPPFSPAAQRCARIVVLSIICNASSSPPLSASPCNRTSHTPDSHQRRNCRQIEFQLPNTSGRSRHGAPVRQIQRAPSNTRRWLAGGRPPRNEAVARNGPTIPHTSSVSKPRITANLHVERSAWNHTARRGGIPRGKKTRCESRLGCADSLCQIVQEVLILLLRTSADGVRAWVAEGRLGVCPQGLVSRRRSKVALCRRVL